MPNIYKKIFISLITSIYLLVSVFALPMVAQAAPGDPTTPTTPAPVETTWYNPGPLEFYTKVFGSNESEIFGERYTYAQVQWIGYSLLALLMGGDIKSVLESALGSSTNPKDINLAKLKDIKVGGATGGIMTLFGAIYSSPPASGVYWLTDRLDSFKIVKTAHAQEISNGFGFSSLANFLPLWKASRNVAFTILVIIVFSIAFGIMFRVKINPQLVVSIQSTLPKIASTLVLITFSYAIVGFLIDLMYLIFGALVYAMNQAGGLGTELLPGDLWGSFLKGSLFEKIFQTAGVGGNVSIGASILILAVVGWQVGVAALPLILGIVIAIVIFFVKTFIMLAQTYFSLVINLVFAPIILLVEAIPFVKASALGWFRSVLADIIVFLAVGLLFLAQSLINPALDSTTSWAPPYLGFNVTILRLLLWVGIWSLLPNIRTAVYTMLEKKAFDVQTPREFSGIGQTASRSFQNYADKQGWFKPGASGAGGSGAGGSGASGVTSP